MIVYRSEDNGVTWNLNTPNHVCVLDVSQNCTIDTDHLSSFTYLLSASSFYINNNASYTNTEAVTLNINIPKANYFRIQNSGSIRSARYGPSYLNNVSTGRNLTAVMVGTTQTRWVNIEYRS